jgi:hypothetical protein
MRVGLRELDAREDGLPEGTHAGLVRHAACVRAAGVFVAVLGM